jgi:hypothetical protein
MPGRQSFKKVIGPFFSRYFLVTALGLPHLDEVVGPKNVLAKELAVRCATNRKINFKPLPHPVLDKARGGWRSTK